MENTYDLCCGSDGMHAEAEDCERLVCEAGTCGCYLITRI